MTTELPIACSLSAAELPVRLAEIGALGRDSLIGFETGDASAELRFRTDPETRSRLARVVAAESECCAFLTMTVRQQPDAISLTIQAPPGGEPVMRELVSAFRGGNER